MYILTHFGNVLIIHMNTQLLSLGLFHHPFHMEPAAAWLSSEQKTCQLLLTLSVQLLLGPGVPHKLDIIQIHGLYYYRAQLAATMHTGATLVLQ